MKKGDKVTILIHGAGYVSKEKHSIEEIDDKSLKVEGLSNIFYKDKKGNYRTHISSFGFWFEIEK